MKFVAIKTVEQLDLQRLHRVRERLVCQRTSVINQIRAFLLERGIAVRQGLRALRTAMPNVLAMTDKLSPRMIHIIEELIGLAPSRCSHRDCVERDETLSEQDDGAKILMTVPGNCSHPIHPRPRSSGAAIGTSVRTGVWCVAYGAPTTETISAMATVLAYRRRTEIYIPVRRLHILGLCLAQRRPDHAQAVRAVA